MLADRVILVTGAGQGIGRTAALTFAEYGATVILHGRKAGKLERVYDEIEALGKASAIILPFDFEQVTEADITKLTEAIHSQIGQLDGILHNVAWINGPMPLEFHTLEHWQTTLQVNLLIPALLTRACFPLLKAASDASVIMTGDTHGQVPAAYWGAFAVAKAGISALVRIQAEEWEIYPNLRINALIPGAVDTPQRTKTHPGNNNRLLPKPEDLMETYLFLMGPNSRGVTGKTFNCQKESLHNGQEICPDS
ncbi:SDR family NAD(P)-dependent oxidoreductase [Nitrosomonas sp. HPC101]|nr:SDR family NAD(P)-dependent oxidoreductase [Nitrosomonas sp. HPC101]